MNICYSTDKTGLNDEQKSSYERNTRFHAETTLDNRINETNSSNAQFRRNNQRRK